MEGYSISFCTPEPLLPRNSLDQLKSCPDLPQYYDKAVVHLGSLIKISYRNATYEFKIEKLFFTRKRLSKLIKQIPQDQGWEGVALITLKTTIDPDLFILKTCKC